jgi:hypothetical protein
MNRQDARYCAEWLTPVGDRFKVGDRVTFSHWADKNGVSYRKRSRTGTVEAITSKLTISVRLDSQKKASDYHHMFFIPLAEAGH